MNIKQLVEVLSALSALSAPEASQAPAPAPAPDSAFPYEGRLVLVRTESAGVHIGNLVSVQGQQVQLSHACRLWSWEGAFTLNEVASKGVSSNSRISARVPQICLLGAIEIIPVQDAAKASLEPNQK